VKLGIDEIVDSINSYLLDWEENQYFLYGLFVLIAIFLYFIYAKFIRG